MQRWTKVLSFVAAFNSGCCLTNLPVEIIERYSELTHFDHRDATIESILETAFCVGSAVGCMVTPMYASRLGFMKSLRMLLISLIVISILCGIPVHWMYLAAMRFLTGFAALSIATLTPLLVAENLDAEQRGKTMMIFAVALNVGVLAAYVAHFAISYDYLVWSLTFALPVVASVVGIVAIQYLIKVANERRRNRITKLTEIQKDDLLQQDVDIQQAGQPIHDSETFVRTVNEETTQAFEQRVKEQQPTIDFTAKLTRTQYARILYITVALGAMQMLTGVDAIIIYASHIFENTFDSEKSGVIGSVIIGAVTTVCTLAAAPFAEHKPRRLMLIIGVIGVGACDILVAVMYFINAGDYVKLACLMSFFIFYNLGPEPIVFMFFAEMFPERYKVKLNGIGYTVNWVANIASVFAFGLFTGGKEWIIYGIFGILTLLLGISGTWLAPETFKRSLSDIEREIRSWTKRKRQAAKSRMKRVQMADVAKSQ